VLAHGVSPLARGHRPKAKGRARFKKIIIFQIKRSRLGFKGHFWKTAMLSNKRDRRGGRPIANPMP
jgi:hypothetical protein